MLAENHKSLSFDFIEHEYITAQMSRNNRGLNKQELVALSKFHRTTNSLFVQNFGLRDGMYSLKQTHLKFEKDYYLLYKFPQTYYARFLKQKFMWASFTIFGFCFYSIYRRVVWYMEHSFDLVKPNIDYIINRYY